MKYNEIKNINSFIEGYAENHKDDFELSYIGYNNATFNIRINKPGLGVMHQPTVVCKGKYINGSNFRYIKSIDLVADSDSLKGSEKGPVPYNIKIDDDLKKYIILFPSFDNLEVETSVHTVVIDNMLHRIELLTNCPIQYARIPVEIYEQV